MISPAFRRLARSLACSVGCGCALLAQSIDRPNQQRTLPFDPREVLSRIIGVIHSSDGCEGIGPGYRVRIDARGCQFVGFETDGVSRLHLAAASIGLSDSEGTWARVGPVLANEVEEATVRVVRTNVTESYALRDDGVELSYTIAALPEGNGDLIVRAELDTELVPSAVARGTDTLELTGKHRAIRIGVVTGVDASGARVRGWMRVGTGYLDFVLPRSFVEAAVLPIVVDPLIGGSFSPINNPMTTWSDADVAYDAANDVFLVAGSGSSFFTFYNFVFAQRVRSSGAFVGTGISIAGSDFMDAYQRGVANVRARGTFVIGFDQRLVGPQVCTVDAAMGKTRGYAFVPAFDPFGTQVLGDSTMAGDRAFVVGPSTLTPVTVLPSGAPMVGTSITIGGAGTAFPRSGGRAGRYLLAWPSANGGIDGAIVDRDLRILDQGPIVSGGGSTRSATAVDGDGSQWVVAYMIRPTPPATGEPQIACIPVFWDGAAGAGYVGSEVIATSSPVLHVQPRVSWVGDSYLVGYVESGAVRVRSIDGFTCTPCEGDWPVSNWTWNDPRIASQKNGDPDAGEVALLLGPVKAQLFRANDGITTTLFGGCGEGGRATATCAVAGNASFSMRLRGARQDVPAVLVVGTQPLHYVCGSCELVPNPMLTIGVGNTNTHGDAAVNVPLSNDPSLVGVTLLEQWVTVPNGSAPCPLGLEFSSALQVQLQ